MNKRIVFAVRLMVMAVGIALILGTRGSLAGPGDEGDTAALKARFWQSAEHAWERSPSAQANGPMAAMAPPDELGWSTIAFQSGRDENWEIYKARADGSEPVRLTNDPAADFRPNLNRDADRILFHSRRDGNSEIYAIDVDGTNLQRLSNSPADDFYAVWSPNGRRIAYSHPTDNGRGIWVMNAAGGGSGPISYPNGDDDIFPTWSPDGSQIAFVRARGGAGSLMVMNADGANPRTVAANLRYLQNPVWSPDGRFIAVDYDYDGDEWNELVVIHLNGGGRRLVFDANRGFVDVWMGAWSPGGNYILFSYITYIIVENSLYIDSSSLVRGQFDPNTSLQNIRALPGSGIDMAPTWQGHDYLAPSSSMEALPGLSPAIFTVRWNGSDAGVSGLNNFDVQVRNGVDADWFHWLMATTKTSAEFNGVGGRSYFFRVRARDHAGNTEPWPPDWDASTTVETLPPQSRMPSVPPMLRVNGLVSWQGSDPGGSGIEYYEAEARDAGQPGVDWFRWYGGASPSGYFNGTAGSTYDLRVRAVDKAGNVEPWPPDPGQARTTLYSWAIAGQVFDRLLRPRPGVVVAAEPDRFAPVETDAEGRYQKYTAASSPSYWVSWTQPGQSTLRYPFVAGEKDVNFDIMAAPGDERILQGGFEGSELAPAWRSSGDAIHLQGAQSAHTGTGSFRLGDLNRLAPAKLVHAGSEPQVGLDSAGRLHLLWRQTRDHTNPDPDMQDIFYKNRLADGVWSDALNLSRALGMNNSYEPLLAVTPDGIAHAAWKGGNNYAGQIYYTRRSQTGAWDQSEVLDSAATGRPSKMLADTHGTAHMVWMNVIDNGVRIRYTWRRQAGQGGAIETAVDLPGLSHGFDNLDMAVLPAGKVYVAWLLEAQIAMRKRSDDGNWTPVDLPNLTSDALSLQIFADNARLHLMWISNQCGGLCYASLDDQGVWSPSRLIDSVSWPNIFDAKMDEAGLLHAVWWKQQGIYYASMASDGEWQAPTMAAMSHAARDDLELALHSRDGEYVVWNQIHSGLLTMTYVWRSLGGVWSSPLPLGEASDELTSASEKQGGVALAWGTSNGYSLDDKVYVTQPRVDVKDAKTNTLEQRIFLPSSLSAPALTFAYRFDPGGPPGNNALAVEVENGAGRHTIFSSGETVSDWTYRSLDVSRWLGQPLTVRFRLDKAAGASFPWAGLDEVSLGSGVLPDLWARAPALMPQPGEVFTFTLPYGNQGEGSAADSELIAVLPPEIGVLAADPAPQPAASSAALQQSQVRAALERQEDGQVLTWDLGRLQAAQAGEVTISARIPVTVAHGTRLQGDLIITTTTLESHSQDNEATLVVLVGNLPAYLPLMLQ